MSPKMACMQVFFYAAIAAFCPIRCQGIGAGVSLPALSIAQISSASPTKVVYAHYMHCFVLGYLPKDDGLSQAEEGDDDLDHWPRAERAYRAFWGRDLSPSCRGGDSALQKDFDLGQRAGLDAFGLLLGPGKLTSQFGPGLEAMFRVAAKNPVKILPEIWQAPAGNMSAEEREKLFSNFGNELKNVMVKYPEGVLRLQGKPVILLARLDLDSCHALTPFFNVWGGPDKFFIIAYDPFNRYMKSKFLASPMENYGPAIKDCPISAVSTWAATDGFGDNTNSALPRVATATHERLDWPINLPFYNVLPDYAVPGPQWISESLGATRFIDQWLAAITQNASLVDLQTWNDFSETTLTDTNLQGVSFIDLNRYFSEWFHTGSPASPTNDKLWLFYHHQLVNAEIEGHRASDPGNRNETPLTDFLEVVSLLNRPGKLELQLGGVHYSLPAPAGFHDWLLYAGPSSVRGAKGSILRREVQATSTANSYPKSSSYRTAQHIQDLSAGLPVVTLSRNGEAPLTLKGRAAIQGKTQFEDLGILGSEAAGP